MIALTTALASGASAASPKTYSDAATVAARPRTPSTGTVGRRQTGPVSRALELAPLTLPAPGPRSRSVATEPLALQRACATRLALTDTLLPLPQIIRGIRT